MKTPKLSTIDEGKLNAQKRIFALLQASGMTARGLRRMTGYDRCTIYRTLSKLRALGLISTRRMDARASVYLAGPGTPAPRSTQIELSLSDSSTIANHPQP